VDAYECVATKLDLREFGPKSVSTEFKLKILDSARLTGSGVNSQHWRFILVQEREDLKRLADDTTTGGWAEGATFAVIIVTNPKHRFHMIDAGRALQSMEIAGWNYGIVSCPITGIREDALRRDFKIPKEMDPAAIVAFGYPSRAVSGKRKRRRSLADIAFLGKYGDSLNPQLV
jgi:nitroreductase